MSVSSLSVRLGTLSAICLLTCACGTAEPVPGQMEGTGPVGGAIGHAGGSDSSEQDGGSSSQCDLDFGSSRCNQCVDQACFSSCSSLATSEGVDDWLDCIGACQSDACASSCGSKCSTCSKRYDTLVRCLDKSCSVQCNGNAAPAGEECAFVVPSKACNDCMNVGCLTSCEWFASSPSASALLTCMQPCQDQACLQGCGQLYPDAIDAYDSLTQCLAGQCSTSCN